MKRGAPDHWKMRDLAIQMKVPVRYGLAWANGTMERLWHYTAKYHPQGDIGKAPDRSIAEACAWPAATASDLITALIDVRWLMRSTAHRLLVHDWPDHADDAVKKTLKNRGLEFFLPENSSTVDGKIRPAFPSLSFPSLSDISASVDAGAFELSAPESVPPPKRSTLLPPKEHEAFDEFWTIRWSSKDKEAARSAFTKAATSASVVKQILSAVANQRAEILSRPLDKRPYMSTWLNKRRFTDEAEPEEIAHSESQPHVNVNGFMSKSERDALAAQKAFDEGMAERAAKNAKNVPPNH